MTKSTDSQGPQPHATGDAQEIARLVAQELESRDALRRRSSCHDTAAEESVNPGSWTGFDTNSALLAGDPRSFPLSYVANPPMFMSGRPDWDTNMGEVGVIDLHICLPAGLSMRMNDLVMLVAQTGKSLLELVQMQAPGSTVHVGLRNSMSEPGCAGKPSWAERIFHAEVNRLFAEMLLHAGGRTAPERCQPQSDSQQPQERDKCSEGATPTRPQSFSASVLSSGQADSAQ